jgi:4-hydroxybutyrate CoA-transferase
MKIGIKYCGGCNPRYDRRKFVEDLIDSCRNSIFEPANENELYDLVLVVCGCFSGCAEHEHLNGRNKLILTSEKDFSRAMKMIQ